ncbi:MAG: fasciclin domain-containing protein [Acidimicrobiales bacterium]|nr:fasciclin domain-containing protein [Acidimicrobiales bacterium]
MSDKIVGKTFRSIACLLIVVFVGAACGSDGDGVATPTSGSETVVEPVVEVVEPVLVDVVDVAVASKEFPTLVAAVVAAGLVDTLKSEGPFTVFAPNEEAFAAALEALGLTADELLADVDTLTAVLTYHVVPGRVMAGDLVGVMAMPVATVNGADITITEDGGTVSVNGAHVVSADIEASNGVIHVIDQVLLP